MDLKHAHYVSMRTLGWTDKEIEMDWDRTSTDLNDFIDETRIKSKTDSAKICKINEYWCAFVSDGEMLEKVFSSTSKELVIMWLKVNYDFQAIEEIGGENGANIREICAQS